MASSDNDMPFERLLEQAQRDLSAFFPFLLGFTDADARRQNREYRGQETMDGAAEPETQERVILINPFTQTMVVLGSTGASGLDALLRGGVSLKEEVPPATKASVEAMPTVAADACGDGECAICLEDWVFGGGVVKEMPCKHRFHGGCIDKWLGMHGSCPVCRYAMPFDEEQTEKKRDEGRVLLTFSMSYGSRREGDSSADGRTVEEAERSV